MRRRFELHGATVETETRQCDVNCWELRITDADGTLTFQYFDNPKLLDEAVARAHRDWLDIGWVSESAANWVPAGQSLSK